MKLSAESEATLAAMRFPCGPNTGRTLIADALDEERRAIHEAVTVKLGITSRALPIIAARIGRERAETKEESGNG